jgi:hypothetical protein
MKFIAIVILACGVVMAQEPIAPADTSVSLTHRAHAPIVEDDQAEVLNALKAGLIAGSVGTVRQSESVMVLQTLDEITD